MNQEKVKKENMTISASSGGKAETETSIKKHFHKNIQRVNFAVKVS